MFFFQLHSVAPLQPPNGIMAIYKFRIISIIIIITRTFGFSTTSLKEQNYFKFTLLQEKPKHELIARTTLITGQPRESIFLFQQLSIALKRGNAVAFRGTFDFDQTPVLRTMFKACGFVLVGEKYLMLIISWFIQRRRQCQIFNVTLLKHIYLSHKVAIVTTIDHPSKPLKQTFPSLYIIPFPSFSSPLFPESHPLSAPPLLLSLIFPFPTPFLQTQGPLNPARDAGGR